MNYHMRRSDRGITDRERLRSILKNGRYAVLALCDGGRPYAVTLSYGSDDASDSLYFHCAHEGRKIECLKNNANVCLTVIEDKGYVKNACEHEYRSIVVEGVMEFVDDEDERLHGIRVLLDHYRDSADKMLNKINTNSASWADTRVMRLKIETITGKERLVKK